jgi:pilus assembly protein Flp/PilA
MRDYVHMWLALRSDKRGVTAMEYGLIAALIAVGIIGSLQLLGPAIAAKFAAITAAITGA